jgi:hypothetical protein
MLRLLRTASLPVVAFAVTAAGCGRSVAPPASPSDPDEAAPGPATEAVRFESRADSLLGWVARSYVPPGTAGERGIPQPVSGVPDPQKYIWPVVMARLRADPQDAWAHAAVGQFWDDGDTPSRHEASFYHFAALGLTRLLFDLPEALAPHREALLRRAMEEEQLFSADGTENHLAMWRTSGYLFAQEAGDARRMAEAARWIVEYSDQLFAVGKGEWDSSTYVAFDVASWLNVADFARDPAIRARARAVVDLLAASMALKWVDGGFAGAEKRGFSGGTHESIGAFLAWLWFDASAAPPRDGFFRGNAIYSVIPALSAYRPSSATLALARKGGWTAPERYRIARPNYAMTHGSQAREVVFATPDWVVGSSVSSPIGGWGGGDTQETMWKFVATGAPDGDAWVIAGAGASYARRSRHSGEGRGPWDQVAQHDDVVIQMTRVPENADRLTANALALFGEWRRSGNADKVSWAAPSQEPWAYTRLPEDATVVEADGVLFVDLGGRAFAAVRPLNGRYAWVEEGIREGTRVARTDGARGEVVGWAYEFGSARTDGDFEAFRAAVRSRSRLDVSRIADGTVGYVGRRGGPLEARFGSDGSYAQPEYDWGPQPAWPAGEGHGRVPRIWVDDRELDLRSPWPAAEGPRLQLQGCVLRVGTGRGATTTRLPRDRTVR